MPGNPAPRARLQNDFSHRNTPRCISKLHECAIGVTSVTVGLMTKSKPLHIFKSGQQTDMSGRTLNFSEADLMAAAAAYDPALHEAPIVVGHPRHDAPAYGWVKSLSFADGGLQAEPIQVDAAFSELVDAGRYKKISASFYTPDSPSNPVPGTYYLRHVGFLGAQPPAVKGLRAVEFAETETGIVEFTDSGLMVGSSLWRRLREFMIRQFGQEAADEVAPNWEIEALQEIARWEDMPKSDAAAFPMYSEALKKPAEVAVTPEQKAALEAENADLKQRLAAANARDAVAAETARHTAHASFAESLITAGKLPPKHKDAVIGLLCFADGDTPLEFGEGKPTAADALKTLLGDMPIAVDFSERATAARAANPETNPLLADAEARAKHQE